jgi:hypothetical protein
MKKILFALIIAAFSINQCFAAFSAADAGTSAAQFLKLGAGARATAMGGAAAGLSSDSTSIYWNPAGLNDISGNGSLTVMNAAWFEGISYDWASYALPVEQVGVFGISAQYVSYGSMQQLDDTGLQTGSFSPVDLCVSLAYAFKNAGINYGVNVKYISLKIVDDASACAVDFGAQYSMFENDRLTLGLAVQNIGSQIKFINEADSLPLNVKFGGAVELNSNWLATLDLNAPIDNAVYAGAGTEYRCKVQEKLSLLIRAGYNTQNSQTGGMNGVTGGLGVKYFDYSLDYAFVPYGNLGNTQRISLTVKF